MTIQDQALVDEVVAIDEGLERRKYNNCHKHLKECFDTNGGHLPNVV